ncbi:MAG TPA: SCO family protein [Verrucomicrobiae bacterium]|nr:SCO family protein [Verrucomicrobiae bacterium]
MATPQQLPRTFWIGSGLLMGFLGLAYLLAIAEFRQQQKPLPVLGQVTDFSLTNQDAKLVTLADLTNRVWVADIIFTRCAGPCPRMTAQMKSVQEKLPSDSSAKLVTLTTDPDYDSSEIMKRYGERFGADFNRWMFLTGTKAQIANLAAGSLKLSAEAKPSGQQQDSADLFIHTTIFVVVDKHAQLRGIFQTGGDNVDWTNAVEPQLLATIRRLERQK